VKLLLYPSFWWGTTQLHGAAIPPQAFLVHFMLVAVLPLMKLGCKNANGISPVDKNNSTGNLSLAFPPKQGTSE